MTEFKDTIAALTAMNGSHERLVWYHDYAHQFLIDHFDKIHAALRIADRLMGDWNEEMYVAFMNEFNPYQPMTESFDAGIKAMHDQILKEIDNDQ